MATYKSQEVTLQAPAETVFAKLSNLENLRDLLKNVPEDKIPDDKKEMFDNIIITADSITVPGGPVGSLTFKVTKKEEPTLIALSGEGAPFAMGLALHIVPDGPVSKARAVIDLEIPAMLKPMVSGPLQKMADQFGDVLKALPFS